MNYLKQAEHKTFEQDHKSQVKIKIIAFIIMFIVLGVIFAAVLVVELGGAAYMKWAFGHPALHARYDPHHGLMRLAALAVLVSFVSVCHTLAVTLREPLAKVIMWRRVFVPMPWERHHKQ